MTAFITTGSTHRYRRDILRAIAQPPGSLLQFRYDRNLVSGTVIKRVSESGLQNDRCLVVYWDEEAPKGTPNLIPCRFGRIIQSGVPGTIVTIEFRLEGYAYAEDLNAFRKEFQDLGLIDVEGKCEILVNPIPLALTKVVESTEIAVWQSLVSQLAPRPKFVGEDFFFTLDSIARRKPRKQLELQGGKLELDSGSEYDLGFFVYHPDHPDKASLDGRINLLSSHEALMTSSGAPIVVDSPYDYTYARLRTGTPDEKQHATLTIQLETSKHLESMNFVLDMPVKGAWRRIAGGIVLVGLLLALPQLITWISTEWLRRTITLVSQLVAAAVVALGLKKIR